jgi:hypothetical protein
VGLKSCASANGTSDKAEAKQNKNAERTHRFNTGRNSRTFAVNTVIIK